MHPRDPILDVPDQDRCPDRDAWAFAHAECWSGNCARARAELQAALGDPRTHPLPFARRYAVTRYLRHLWRRLAA
jgi:hypothetical protein